MPNVSSAEYSSRLALTKVRMLRVAVDLHRGTTGSLPDPLGEGPLTVLEEPEGRRILSVGERNGEPVERVVRR